MTKGLKDALIEFGHEVEIVTIPFKFHPESYIDDLIDIWMNQDFNEFNGYSIDKVIALQFPAYYVKHRSKIIWLMHQHRTVYELFDENISSRELVQLRGRIIEKDNDELSVLEKIFSMSETVSARLSKYNGINSIPIYHPPQDFNKFYCEESYGYIFCPSRLERLKRQDLLIEAMRYVRSPVKAIIAGDGGQNDYYSKLIGSYGIGDKVGLIGRFSEEEKITLYARSLAVFFAPFDEDYGYITLESMLSSKLVITCVDSGGPLEFVEDSINGFVLQPDPKQIAEKIDWLWNNKVTAREMGQVGLEIYRSKNISWRNVVDKLLEM